MGTEEDEIKSLTALIAQESAAAHEALRLELDNYDELSLSVDEDSDDDEPKTELQYDIIRGHSPPPIGLKQKESIEESIRSLRGHLPVQELDLIINCPKDEDGNTTLQRCMILNRSKRMELLQTYEHYSNIMWKLTSDDKHPTSTTTRDGFNQWLLNKASAPYFKIDKGFSYDPNADVLRMRASGELSCHFVATGRRRWTLENQANLRGAIRLSHYMNKKAKLERDLKYLNFKASRCEIEKERDNYLDEIKKITEELRINQVNYEKHFPHLDSDDFIDWEDISMTDLQGKFSATTCKAMWRLFLHPDINNDDWSASEIDRVHNIVALNNYQRWEETAKALGSKRSSYLLCVHFFKALVDRFDRDPFTCEESSRLKSIIDQYIIQMGERRQNAMPGNSGSNYIPWAKVARDFGSSRSRQQLYMHYMYRLRDRDHRILGSFTASEDVQILYFVGKYGENFTLIAENMNRSSLQLRSHYLTYLKPLNTEQIRNWTSEDDAKLIELVKLFGNRFSMISRELDRTVGSVRGRFKTIRRYLETGTELKDMPRRKRVHRQVVARCKSKVLADILTESNEPLDLEYLRDTFKEKEVKPPSVSKIGRPPLKYDLVDQQLTTYFKMTAGGGRSFKLRQITEDNLNRCATSIRNIFSVLNVTDLDIPTIELNTHGSSFDEIDINLLSLLRNDLDDNDNTKTEDDDIYLPPSASSLSALKGLLMGTKSVEKPEKITDIREQFRNDLSDLNQDTQNAVSNDRAVFIERLHSILLWPSILSLKSIETTAANAEPEPKMPLVVKPIRGSGRPKQNRTKIQKMVAARKKQRAKIKSNCGEGDETDDSTISELSGVDNVESANIPSTSRTNTLIKPNLVLNKNAATSVEEVNQLLQAGKSLGSTKTLVKIDKKTMQQMQKDIARRHIKSEAVDDLDSPSQAKKKIKREETYVHSRNTRSKGKSPNKMIKSTIEDEDDIVALQNDISTLDSILRTN